MYLSCYNQGMRVLVIADKNPHLDYAHVIAENQVQLVITLGDLEREHLIGLESVTTPKIGVYGNHDTGTYMEEFGIMNLHQKVWDWNGLKIAGLQGCVRYKDDPTAIMYTQEEAQALMQDCPQVDIFICHCPPRGINDEPEVAHQGFDALRSYIDRTPPRVLLHGHTYPTEDTIVRQYGQTRIEYTSGWRIVEL